MQVTIVTRRAEDDLLLLASDGLWDVLSNQVCRSSWACSLTLLPAQACTCRSAAASRTVPWLTVSSTLRAQACGSRDTPCLCLQEACTLAKRCLKRARQRGASRQSAARIAATVLTRAAIDRGSRDNVTVVVVDLTSGDRCELTACA